MNLPAIDHSSFSAYGWITLGGIITGAWLWARRWKRSPQLLGIFIGGMCGAFFGAKMVYLSAEGWLHLHDPNWLYYLATGKTITGALLGGYAGVEFTKYLVGHQEPTGDWFALVVPLGIAMGRIGCLRYGCCLGEECDPGNWYSLVDRAGVSRWPAVPLELAFNLLFVAVILPIQKAGRGKGQLFHIYLISYGLFRFWHEFHRATPLLIFGLSGYQLAATSLVLLGVVMGWRRMHFIRGGSPMTPVDSMQKEGRT